MARCKLLVFCLGVAGTAHGHSVSQKLGGYEDTGGLTRQRAAFDATVEGKGGLADMSASTVSVSAVRDVFAEGDLADDKYTREVYGESRRVNDGFTLATSQTWDRITETRLMGSYASDGKVRTRSVAGGMSQWLGHETVRVGLDLSRTVVEQPLYQVLDYDSREVGNPTIASSVGATVTVRHLATPTTIVDYSASRVELENRPAINTGSVGLRQFIPPADGAVHLTVTRADNRGYVTTETTYGQVDAWIGEIAYLQNLWRGGRGRAAYRYYEEDEVTRAYGDERQLGSDTVTVALSQDLDQKSVDGLGTPITIDAAGSRYANNDGTGAKAFELGITARF